MNLLQELSTSARSADGKTTLPNSTIRISRAARIGFPFARHKPSGYALLTQLQPLSTATWSFGGVATSGIQNGGPLLKPSNWPLEQTPEASRAGAAQRPIR